MNRRRGRPGISLIRALGKDRSPAEIAEFLSILKAIYGTKKSDKIRNPIEKLESANPKNRSSRSKTMRKINHLLGLGVLRLEVDHEAIRDRIGRFNSDYWAPYLDAPEAGILASYLADVRGVKLTFGYTVEQVYQKLLVSLDLALRPKGKSKVLISHGRTIAGWVKYFQEHLGGKDNLSSLIKESGEPIFYPANGNFSSGGQYLTSEQFQYFFSFSANENSQKLNSALMRNSLRLSIPALIPTPSDPEGAGEFLVKLKLEYRKDGGYQRIYDRYGRLHPQFKTLLFTFGSPLGAEGKLSYTKFLSEYDSGLKSHSVDGMDEILFRFYKHGELQGQRSKDESPPTALDLRLEQIYESYLGLKENSAYVVAELFRNQSPSEREGLGSVMVATDTTKMRSLLLALLKTPEKDRRRRCFINEVYFLHESFLRLPKLMEKMPARYIEDYNQWRLKLRIPPVTIPDGQSPT